MINRDEGDLRVIALPLVLAIVARLRKGSCRWQATEPLSADRRRTAGAELRI
jgi:hypothetical protein